MKQILSIILVIFVGIGSISAQKKLRKVKIETKIDTISYCLGVLISDNLKKDGIKEINPMAVARAFNDVMQENDLLIDAQTADIYVQNYFKSVKDEQSIINKKEGMEFLEANKKKEGVVTLESGLQYKVLKKGTGETPEPSDKVKVHYKGSLVDGTVFDSSYDRGQPITLGVNQVIQGWTEALLLMKEGDKWTLYIPYNLGYGERGAGGQIPPFATLIFDVELISIEK